jgi:amino-acid N-acetyltransferase
VSSDLGPSKTSVSYSVQAASEKQAKAIKRLVYDSGINPTALDWRRFSVALDEKRKLIGCGQVKVHADGSRELASLAVVPAMRGQGIGRALIEQLISTHDDPHYLMCQSSLGTLYERFGFVRIEGDEMPKYFRRVSQLAGVLANLRAQGETLFIMQRGLSE